jgi:hypothetical protein
MKMEFKIFAWVRKQGTALTAILWKIKQPYGPSRPLTGIALTILQFIVRKQKRKI